MAASQKTWILSFTLLIGTFGASLLRAQDDDLSVLDGWMTQTNARNALYLHLKELSLEFLNDRQQTLESLDTAESWWNRVRALELRLGSIVGPFPEKTRLNVQVTGVLQREGYRVEKLVYESQPGYLVTAALFIPEAAGPRPAVIFCSGHSEEGYRSDVYQKMILSLVRNGFVVFAFDPVGQGERLQYFDPKTGGSRVGGPTKEHSYPGAQAFLIGVNPARYFIWDGIRAVDYLLTRSEVDPNKIGITGRSGGGTQSAYIAAFDPRIGAAAPECYITGFRRLLESIGPQDAEQNFLGFLSQGLDHGDLLTVRAPRPALIVSTTRDFFSIQGVRETYAEVRNAYEVMGVPEGIGKVEDDAPHASTEANRREMYRFFQRAFGLTPDGVDWEGEPLPVEELYSTSTGQLSTSLKSRTMFDLIGEEVAKQAGALSQSREKRLHHLQEVREAAERYSGYRRPDGEIDAVFTGRFRKENYSIEKYMLQGEGRYQVPFLVFVPDAEAPHPAVVYLNPNGKAVDAEGRIEDLVRQGYLVLSPDLPGYGELGSSDFTGDADEFSLGRGQYNIWFFAALLGRSVVGVQAGDLVRCLRYLQSRQDVSSDDISGIGEGNLGAVLVHAAALSGGFKNLIVQDSLSSFIDLASTRYYRPEFILGTVPGATRSYDLPDLLAALAPTRLLVVNPLDAEGNTLKPETASRMFEVVRKSYDAHSTKANFRVLDAAGFDSNQVKDWLTNSN